MTSDAAQTDLEQFAKLTDLKRKLEHQLNDIRAQINSSPDDGQPSLQERVTAHFLNHGIQSINLNSSTVYLTHNLSVRAKASNYPALAREIQQAGLDHLVSVNHSSLRSWCKEAMTDAETGAWELQTDKLPESIRGHLDVREYHSVNCRKS